MSNFLLQLEASNVDLIPSSLLAKRRLSSSSASAPSPVPTPQNLISVDPRTSILYVASYPSRQESEASSPTATNVSRVYAYPYACLSSEARRPVELHPLHATEKAKFIPRSTVLSPEGDFLAIVGAKRVQVLKLHPITRKLSLHGTSHKRPSSGERQQVLPEGDRADSYGVDAAVAAESFFIDAPAGATIYDVIWHPLSFTHLVILTSNNDVIVYNMLGGAAAPEQAVALPAGRPRAVALAFPSDAAASLAGKGPSLDERFLGWNALACFVLYEDGRADALCPVVPYDVYIAKRVKEDLACCPPAAAPGYAAFVEAALARLVDGSEVYDDEFFVFRKDAASPLEIEPVEVIPPLRSGAKGASLVYCLGSPSVLVRVASDGMVDLHVLCSDMCPRWKSDGAGGAGTGAPEVVVAHSVRSVCLGDQRNQVVVDSNAPCVVCRANGAQIFVRGRCERDGTEALFDVDLSGAWECLQRRFESEDTAPIREDELEVVVRRVELGKDVWKILGVGFHGSKALLVLDGDGRLRVITNEANENAELPVVAEPLKIELNDTTNPAYALLCEKMFGGEYLGKITEIKELLLESKKRMQHIKELNESLRCDIAKSESDEGLVNTAITYAMRNIESMARIVSRQCDLEARLACVSEKLTPLPGAMVTPLRVLEEKVAVLRQRVAALEACCGDGPRRVEAASVEYANAVRTISEDYDNRVFELFNDINRISSEVRAILSMSAAAEAKVKKEK